MANQVGQVTAETMVHAVFTAADTLDLGMDTGSAVALEYQDSVPFVFKGKINKITIRYID